MGASSRRIEAVTSAQAIEHYRGLEREVETLAGELDVRPERLAATVRKQVGQVAELRQKLRAVESGARIDTAAELVAAVQEISGAQLVASSPPVESADELLAIADQVRERLPDAAVILASEVDGKVPVVVSVGDGAVGRGVHAQEVLRAMLPAVEGRGGGKPNLARGAGSRPEGIEAAVAAGADAVRRALGG